SMKFFHILPPLPHPRRPRLFGGYLVRRYPVEFPERLEILLAPNRVGHVHVGGHADQRRDPLAVRGRFSPGLVVDGPAKPPAEFAGRAWGLVAINDEPGDILPAATARDPGLVRMHREPLVLDDPAGRAQERPDPRRSQMIRRKAEGQVVGIAGVAPAQ